MMGEVFHVEQQQLVFGPHLVEVGMICLQVRIEEVREMEFESDGLPSRDFSWLCW